MQCMPEGLENRHYYHPGEQGDEAAVKKRLTEIQEWKKKG